MTAWELIQAMTDAELDQLADLLADRIWDRIRGGRMQRTGSKGWES